MTVLQKRRNIEIMLRRLDLEMDRTMTGYRLSSKDSSYIGPRITLGEMHKALSILCEYESRRKYS